MYITLEEFKKASHPSEIPSSLMANVNEILAVCNKLREAYGKPLYLLAGGSYRSPEFNSKIGGSRGSKHLEGLAVDLRSKPSSHEEIDKLASILEGMLLDGSLASITKSKLGIGRYYRNTASFLHIDVRKGPPARWEEDTYRQLNKKDEDKE